MNDQDLENEVLMTGDVVRLISGGPSLTISHVGPRSVGVTWFTSDGQINEALIYPAMLKKHPPNGDYMGPTVEEAKPS